MMVRTERDMDPPGMLPEKKTCPTSEGLRNCARERKTSGPLTNGPERFHDGSSHYFQQGQITGVSASPSQEVMARSIMETLWSVRQQTGGFPFPGAVPQPFTGRTRLFFGQHSRRVHVALRPYHHRFFLPCCSCFFFSHGRWPGERRCAARSRAHPNLYGEECLHL